MTKLRMINGISAPIPSALNLTLFTVAASSAIALLWTASHVGAWYWVLLSAVAFSYVNNTIFSLLHEATHGTLHADQRLNDVFGRLAAAFFPTTFTLQRRFHLNHHRNNRSEVERFDYIQPGENKVVKYLQWYSVLTGVYWSGAPLACVLYFFCPWVFKLPILRQESTLVQQTSSDAYLSMMDDAPALTVRLEVLLTVGIQLGLFYALDLSFWGWAACYACFAFNWSSLQYADHAWSPLDVREGAWNLEVNPVIRAIFLNYHYHLAHHQHPGVPWNHLEKFIEPDAPRPSFLKIYLRMWLGPKPLPEPVAE